MHKLDGEYKSYGPQGEIPDIRNECRKLGLVMSCKKCTEDSDTDCGCFCGKPHASIGDSDVCAVEDWHGYSNSYGRGAGYAWEASMGTDFETAKQKQIKKCEDDADNWEDTWNNGSGECELCLSLTYPKCKWF